MKRRIFLVCLFYCYFRLPVYESIAAIFWQSASYVYNLFIVLMEVFKLLDCLDMRSKAKSRRGVTRNSEPFPFHVASGFDSLHRKLGDTKLVSFQVLGKKEVAALQFLGSLAILVA